jgi:parvulin-like peptidyl-prolyl isomerase
MADNKMNYRRLCVIMFVLPVVAMTGHVWATDNKDDKPALPSQEVLAKVNGQPIYRRDLDHQLLQDAKRGGRTPKIRSDEDRAAARQRRQEALEKLVDRALLCQEAADRGYVVDEKKIEEQWTAASRQLERGGPPNAAIDEKLAQSGFTEEQYKTELRNESLFRMLRQKLTPKSEDLSEKEIETCYEEFKYRFKTSPSVHFRELLVSLPPFAGKDKVDAAQSRVKTIRSKLGAGTSFEALVREYSDAASAGVGGDSGWKTRAKLGDEAADLAFSLKPGEVGGPIETSTGLVLIQLIEKEESQFHSLEKTRAGIVAFLREKKRDDSIDELVAKLRKTAKVEHVVRP